MELFIHCLVANHLLNRRLYATTLAGFAVHTIRPEDTSANKGSQLSSFNNPDSNAQIFLANINIMATGVNLQKSLLLKRG